MARFKRQQGYFTFAQCSNDLDYIRMAYALALSLRATQSEVPYLAVGVESKDLVPKEYAWAFDEIIEIPWHDDAWRYVWKIHNKWKVYYMTPYEETVLLDADMLFTTDVSHWWDWDILADNELRFTTQPMTYRGEPILRERFRQAFIDNGLPMVYTAFAYIRQGKSADEYFALLQKVFRNWRMLYETYRFRQCSDEDLQAMASTQSTDRWEWTHFLKNFPKDISGDLAYALTAKIMGIEELCAPERTFPTFTHMKLSDQGIRGLEGESWSTEIPWYLKDDLTLLVGNHVQRYPFHYVEKDWLTDETIAKLEKANG